MLRKTLPPELRNLKIARHPIFIMGLMIAALSLAANIGYWTRGMTGQSFWINFVFAGMVEVIFVFLIWLSGNIWKSGGRVLAAALILLSLVPWLGSSVSNFMFLSTLKEPQLASAQNSIDQARENVLQSDLTRYANELSKYTDVIRKDVGALEERRAFCDRASREECSSVDLADEIAINKKINELEENQAAALLDLQTLAEQRTEAIKASEFSITLLRTKFDGNWLSREFIMVAFLDSLKAILFLVGIWINLRLHKAARIEREEQVDLLASIDVRLEELKALQASIDAKSAPIAKKKITKKPKPEPAAKTPPPVSQPVVASIETPTTPVPRALEKPPASNPRQAQTARTPSTIEYKQRQADGSTVLRRKSIA